jgi:hypothetical protein
MISPMFLCWKFRISSHYKSSVWTGCRYREEIQTVSDAISTH